MKERFFHVSAEVIADGVCFPVERLFCIDIEEFHSNNHYFPLADIRKYIAEGVSEETNKKYKRITFPLNHIEEISENDYDEMMSVFKEYDDAD